MFLTFVKRNTVAEAGYSRWLMCAAALLIHIPLGQAYAFSVFNGPLASVLHVSLTDLGWVFAVAIGSLGASAAVLGRWVESVGPRFAMFVSACCFCSGLLVSALGVYGGSLGMVICGYGVLGGIGLGVGYISPVSTLLKWFPDKKGMATGLAIMGFGGGAIVGSPLAVNLMKYYASGDSLYAGVPETLTTMAAIYAVLQFCAVWIARVPPVDFKPVGWEGEQELVEATMNGEIPGYTLARAIRTRQFWLLWTMLLCMVSAGIGILGQASLMSQKMLGIGMSAGAGFVGLLSLCNMAGRIVWSSFSDVIGRQYAYAFYCGAGFLAYCWIPGAAQEHDMILFVGLFALVMSFYGAGFSTIPAYLSDMFGKREVGAIHGRLLTAWSVAGVVGPLVVNGGRDWLVKSGLTDAQAYSQVVYVLSGLLAIAFVCNIFVKTPEQPDGPTITVLP